VRSSRRSAVPVIEERARHLSDLEQVQLLAQEAQLLLEHHSGGDGGEDGEDRS
jgi:hypothetical protein